MDHPIELENIEIPIERKFNYQSNSELKQKILDGWTSKTQKIGSWMRKLILKIHVLFWLVC